VAAQRRESSVETRWRAGDPADPDVGGQQSAQASDQGQKLGLIWPRRSRIGIGQGVDWNVGMGDLPGGMHAGVGAPRRAYPHRRPEHRRKCVLQEAGDGALTRLSRPAHEIGSVVSDIEPKTNTPAIGVDGGCVVER
jgi:hypothetical protein